MSPTLDVKRAFRKSKYVKPTEEPPTQQLTDTTDRKARHILGLDATHIDSGRNNSTSSTSTTKLPSVTFSDATTAAVSAGSTTDTLKDEPSHPDYSRKASSVLLKGHRTPEIHDIQIKPQVSNTSLRSFYDKSRAPLSVSQQTSDSSTRDFALRVGVPSILSTPSQEMEHSKQLRFFSRSQKSKHDKTKLGPHEPRPGTTASQRSLASFETRSDAGESVASQPSVSRVSVTKGILKSTPKSPAPSKHQTDAAESLAGLNAKVDPARAKVNVRRPKAGARNWFDSLDSDSSDGESTKLEPQLNEDFAIEVEAAFDCNGIDRFSPRRSSKAPMVYSPVTAKAIQTSDQPKSGDFQELIPKASLPKRSRKPKVNRLAVVDLTKQSILLSSSDDEDEEQHLLAPTSYQELARMEIRESLMNGAWDESAIELGQAMAVDTKEPERLLQQMPNNASTMPAASRQVSSRHLTYLDDRSSGALTQHHDLLTSFPRTPSETPSRGTSVRESIGSEDASVFSTKLMTVTRQEEDLIAAMRLKKTAMKRAQAVAHRQGALQILELDSNKALKSRKQREKRLDRLPAPVAPSSPLRLSYLASPSTLRHGSLRPDSGTTFQSDSIQQPSVRSSMATYLSEGSEDLQLPYSSIDGLPIGSTSMPQRMKARPDMAARDTFLSEKTTTTTDTASYSEWSPSGSNSVRGSHVVVLDPLERQLLREEIPSQLFMEPPFLGWEARANFQIAH
ncbi:hypothetical protein LTR70_000257 [Exophiala xenobiotica]|nr:hypothetical protein LTR70_000257 [Exophiala xenobiotica]